MINETGNVKREEAKREETIVVGLGEIKVTKDASAVLTCLGLGSCVGIAVYDPVVRVGGMAHIVLPSSNGREGEPSPKYADVGVPMLVREMRELGALKSRLVVKIAGGAQMSRAPGLNGVFKIGENNIAAVRSALVREGIPLAVAETGGNSGRTLRVYLETGKTVVSHAGREAREL